MALLALWSCNEPADPALSSHISGTINPVYQEYLAFTYSDFLDSTQIDQDGHFTIDVPATEAGYGMLMYNNSLVELYIEPGKTLDIDINSNIFPDNIEFGSELGPINHYLQLARKLDRRTDISSEDLYRKDAVTFSQLTDSIRDTKHKLLQEYIDKYPEFDSSFAIKKSTDIVYTWASQQLLYPGYYALLKNQIPQLPDGYHQKYLEILELDNSDFLISPMYKTFLENYLDYKEAVYLENHPDVEKLWFPGSVARFRVIHEEFTDEEVKNFLLFRSMGDHLDNFGIEHIETFITNFRVSCTNEEYRTQSTGLVGSDIFRCVMILLQVGLRHCVASSAAPSSDHDGPKRSFAKLFAIAFWTRISRKMLLPRSCDNRASLSLLVVCNAH